MLISESGVSRQIELTRFRLRLAFGIAVGIVAVLAAAFLTVRSAVPVDRSVIAERDSLSGKVRGLEERLQKQELELTVRANRLQEMEESLARAVTEQPTGRDLGTQSLRPRGDGRVAREGPLTSISEPNETSRSGPSSAEASEETVERAPAPSGRGRATESRPTPAARSGEESEAPPASVSPTAFDAQDVKAVADGAHKGKVSFRLVKDNPKVRFSGYLFVFVEMADTRGDSKIFAYPYRTRLGDGFLPQDHLSGKMVAFKVNTTVEVDYVDKRANTSLSRVTVILYNEDGTIVFQRGFDRSEVKLVSAPATKTEAVQPAVPQPEKKRQAL